MTTFNINNSNISTSPIEEVVDFYNTDLETEQKELELENQDEDEDEEDNRDYFPQGAYDTAYEEHKNGALLNEGEIHFYRAENFMSLASGTNKPKAKIRLLDKKGKIHKAKSFAYAVYTSGSKEFAEINTDFKRFYPDPTWNIVSARTSHTNDIVTGKRDKTEAVLETIVLKAYLEATTRRCFIADPVYTGDIRLEFENSYEIIFTDLAIDSIESVIGWSMEYVVQYDSAKKQEARAIDLDVKEKRGWVKGDKLIGVTCLQDIINNEEQGKEQQRLWNIECEQKAAAEAAHYAALREAKKKKP